MPPAGRVSNGYKQSLLLSSKRHRRGLLGLTGCSLQGWHYSARTIVLWVTHERLAGQFRLDQFRPLPHDADNVGTGSLTRTNDLTGSLHQFVLLQLVGLFYLLRRTTHRIVWAMGNHGDAYLAVGDC